MKISASALKDVNKCMRMAVSKKLGFRSPMGPAAKLGTDTHKLFETYVGESLLPEDASSKAARLFYEGLPFAPKPGEATAERYFVRDWDHEITFHGYIDFDAPGLVGDYKTSSRPEPPDLLKDEQGVLYGWDNNCEHGTETTEAKWIYMHTQRFTAFEHKTPMTLEHCENQITNDLAPRARVLIDLNESLAPLKDAPLADKVNALNVIQNQPDVFGMTCKWCAFEPHCKKYNIPGKKTTMAEMTIQERLKAMKNKVPEKKVEALQEVAAESLTVPPEAKEAIAEAKGELAGEPEPVVEKPAKKTKAKTKKPATGDSGLEAVANLFNEADALGLKITITNK